MHIKGESLGNVAFGIDYLANSKAFRLGDDIAPSATAPVM